MITGNTEVNKWRRVSAGSLTIRYTGYLTNPFSKLKSRRPPLYKGQTGQKKRALLHLEQASRRRARREKRAQPGIEVAQARGGDGKGKREVY